MTREKVVLYGERAESKNQAPWMGGYWFLKICFSREGCEKYIRFFFWKCHVSRWTRQGFYFQDNRVCNRIFIFFRRILIGILRALFRFEEDLYKIKNKNIYIYIWERNYLYFVVEKSIRKIVYWNYIDRTGANIFGWNYERVGYIYSNS